MASWSRLGEETSVITISTQAGLQDAVTAIRTVLLNAAAR